MPAADATNGLRPVPFPTVPIAVLAIALASLSSAVIWRPEFRTIREMLDRASTHAVDARGSIAGAIAVAGLVLVPLELMAIAAGVMLGAPRGAAAALLGALAGAALGYVAGPADRAGTAAALDEPALLSVGEAAGCARRHRRARAAAGIGRQRGIDPSALRRRARSLLDVHGRHPAGFVPAIAALAALGVAASPDAAQSIDVERRRDHRRCGVVLTAAAAVLRTLLLIRQFAPSVSSHRARAEFG